MAKKQIEYPNFSPKVECPFFSYATPKAICCECAISSKGTSIHHFSYKKEKDKHFDEYWCKDRGEGCLYYNSIMLKYEQDR